jgi:PAS domain S-box-containing protein
MTELSAYKLSPLLEGEFVLYRGVGDGRAQTLLVASAGEYPSPGSLKRLEHQYALRADLDANWAARPVGLVRHEARLKLVLEDPGGEPLERLLDGPLEIGPFLHIAVPLAAAIGHMHARGLIHKDLKPANILVDIANGGVWLTGFGVASRLPRERQGLAPPEVIAGTLAYMAPEQTGRMNRLIDSRSDLYALGVILYQMLTGVLPFTASDPLEWIHCHIARQPVSPSERNNAVPAQLSAIVMKLLAKTTEERYQTAGGVEADLRRCLLAWEAHHRIDPFPVAASDVSDRLVIAERLYGREAEVDTLLAAFDRVVTQGTTEFVVVSGYSGIGKSSIVHELHKVVPPGGLFASGKFDQYKRDIPYATPAQALQSLVRHLLSMGDAELSRWRDALLEALGPNGQLMVNLIPELALVIGEQPPIPDLPPQDQQKRFQLVFRRLLSVFARPEHPLVLFLDDLQWMDAATLELIEHLVTEPEVQHLMLVGAYRDNEVDRSHPLMRTLEAIRKAGGRVQEIVVAPLGPDEIEELIADSLHCEREIARPLAHLVHEKTAGNPFFAVQFLMALAEERLLVFDHGAGAWSWNLPAIHAKGFTDNVANLMAAKLGQLPDVTQEALGQLACLGNAAQIATMTLVSGESEQALHEGLWEAVRTGLVFRLDDAYAFLHDRVQEAAYALIPKSERAATHLRIGRSLSSRIAPGEVEEAIFDVVNHLNRGAELITTREEREHVAELNLIAGKRAKSASACSSALKYLNAGAGLLAEDCWERRYDLAFALELHCAECEFVVGDLASTEERLSRLSRRADSLPDAAAVAGLRMDLYTLMIHNDSAVAVCLDYLRRVGIDWSAHPSDEEVWQEYERIWRQLGKRKIEELIDLPLMSDSATRATMDVLTKLMPSAFMSDENLACLMSARMVNLSLEHGNGDASCCGYVWFGMVLGSYFGDYQSGFRFSQLSVDLVNKRGLDAFIARVYMNFVNGNGWTQPVRSSRAFVQRAFDEANRVGDLVYAGHCCHNLVTLSLASAESLSDVEREAENGLDFARKLQFGIVVDMITGQLRLIRLLRGLTSEFTSLNDSGFDAAQFEQRLEANPNLALPACFYWVRKLQALVWANDYPSALEAAAKAQKLLWTSRPFFEHAEYQFYAGLAQAASSDVVPAPEGAPHMEALTAHYRQLEIWAQHCQENFEDRRLLLAAEIARFEGRSLDAERLYEDAIQKARENGFVQNEALANECAARFYTARNLPTIAACYLRNARDCCLRWGAEGKARQLEQSYPRLREEPAQLRLTTTLEAPLAQFDLATVVKIYQTVSGEIVLEKLIETLMVMAVEHAGAERGLLVLPQGDKQLIEAAATTGRDTVMVRVLGTPATPRELPDSVLQYVIRTQDSVILDDALALNPFSADPYIHQKRARSVLCLPLVKQAKLIGTLYLENNLASHVFTPARIAVLKLLASQAAISIENARLYAELVSENRDRQLAEDALRVSEERWRSLFENVPIGVGLIGRHGQYVATNQAFQKMLGYSEAELRERTPIDITHEDDRSVSAAIRAAQVGGDTVTWRREKRYRRKDGIAIWADVSSFLLPVARDSPLTAVFAIDITDRKLAEDKLRRSEASLAQAQQISHTGSWHLNLDSGEVGGSTELFRIFGFDLETEQPTYAAFMDRLHPEDRSLFEEALNRAARERSRFQCEYRIVLADGSVNYLQSVGQPDNTKAGRHEFVGTVIDITERRHAEEALRNAEAELVRVARLTTMGQLVASIAHEINQPLAAIATNGTACLRWLNRDQPDLDEAQNTVSRIVREAHRAGDIIHGIRALTRKSAPQKTKLTINSAIQEVLSLAHSELQRNGIALHTDLSVEVQPVFGDRVQLQQVLLNLITNAIDAMNTVMDHTRELWVSSAPTEMDGVLVAIADTGAGLHPTVAQRIFEPFFTTKSQGLGMGLSICRSIIESHDGRLWVSPNVPYGTVFSFTVPGVPRA